MTSNTQKNIVSSFFLPSFPLSTPCPMFSRYFRGALCYSRVVEVPLSSRTVGEAAMSRYPPGLCAMSRYASVLLDGVDHGLLYLLSGGRGGGDEVVVSGWSWHGRGSGSRDDVDT